MPDQPAGRLVWLTQAQRNLISACATSFSPIISQPLDEIVAAFDAAPRDPDLAIARAVYEAPGDTSWDDAGSLTRSLLLTDATNALKALGCPPSEHTRDAS